MSADSIAIAVTFLAEGYHGAEWPPSPARLYQALLAGVMTGGYRTQLPEIEPALRWLETQRPPTISVRHERKLPAYRIAVPNNDLDRAGLEWAAGREANPAQYRTLKTIAGVMIPGDGPHVVYRWQADSGEIARWAERLRSATHCLHTLGWGIDMAFADFVIGEVSGEGGYAPSEQGRLNLDVPMQGTLDDLRATYRRFVARTSGKGADTYTHPSVVDTIKYIREGQRQAAVAQFRLLDTKSEPTRSVAWADCMKVAGWLRHAAAQALIQRGWPAAEVAAYVQGHIEDDDKSRRLSYVPLPSIAGPHGDGRIRRVMIVEPATGSGKTVAVLVRALNGRALTDDAGNVTAYISAANAQDYTFEQYVSSGKESRVWRSVTPVVLHGFNVQRKGVIDVNKTMKLLMRSFEMAGHRPDTIESLSFQAGPLWRGTGHASAILVPQHLAKFPRVHVQVEFKNALPGPVLAGIGRHYGIGLFASVPPRRD